MLPQSLVIYTSRLIQVHVLIDHPLPGTTHQWLTIDQPLHAGKLTQKATQPLLVIVPAAHLCQIATQPHVQHSGHKTLDPRR